MLVIVLVLVVGAYCCPQGCDAGEPAASQHLRAGVGPCQGARSPQVRDAQYVLLAPGFILSTLLG